MSRLHSIYISVTTVSFQISIIKIFLFNRRIRRGKFFKLRSLKYIITFMSRFVMGTMLTAARMVAPFAPKPVLFSIKIVHIRQKDL